MKIRLPASVKMILDSLHAAGHQAFAAGGCVRDAILGRDTAEWDIITPARPEQVTELFPESAAAETGGEYVKVSAGSGVHRVSSYRIESARAAEAGRPEEDRTAARSLRNELTGREFTVDAMAYSEEEGLLDLFGGMKDLQKKIIRFTGDPRELFREDPLRMMRAVRGASRLGFSLETETAAAVREMSGGLSGSDPEGVRDELTGILISPHPEYLKLAWELGLTKVFLPEFDRMMRTPQNTPYHYLNVGEHTIAAICATPQEAGPEELRLLRLTMLLHDAGKPQTRTTDKWGIDHFKGHADVSIVIAEEVLERLRFDKETIGKVITLIRYHDWRIHPVWKDVIRLVSLTGEALFPYLMQVQYADTVAQSDYIKEETLKRITEVYSLFLHITEEETFPE